jgi:hypothetical protein
MAGKRAFEIAFVGLKPGIHEFNYVVDNKFFAEKGFQDFQYPVAHVKMLLEKNSRAATAFTVPGKGKFEWLTTSMGLRGAVSSFQRMVELTMKGVQNLIVYIDDLLAHNKNHAEHRQLLQIVFNRLRHTGLKANLLKCL